jgi:hypothetical protein
LYIVDRSMLDRSMVMGFLPEQADGMLLLFAAA